MGFVSKWSQISCMAADVFFSHSLLSTYRCLDQSFYKIFAIHPQCDVCHPLVQRLISSSKIRQEFRCVTKRCRTNKTTLITQIRHFVLENMSTHLWFSWFSKRKIEKSSFFFNPKRKKEKTAAFGKNIFGSSNPLSKLWIRGCVQNQWSSFTINPLFMNQSGRRSTRDSVVWVVCCDVCTLVCW